MTIRELRTIVNDGEGIASVAHGAKSWLENTAAIYFNGSSVVAHVALEESLTHFGNDVASPDDHTADTNKLINVCGREMRAPLVTNM